MRQLSPRRAARLFGFAIVAAATLSLAGCPASAPQPSGLSIFRGTVATTVERSEDGARVAEDTSNDQISAAFDTSGRLVVSDAGDPVAAGTVISEDYDGLAVIATTTSIERVGDVTTQRYTVSASSNGNVATGDGVDVYTRNADGTVAYTSQWSVSRNDNGTLIVVSIRRSGTLSPSQS